MNNETYYRELSEMYAFKNEAELKPYNELLLAKGVLYKMEDELLSYGLKSGNKEKIKDAKDRLNILFQFIELISSVLSENTQLRILLKDSMVQRSNLEDLLISMDKQNKFADENNWWQNINLLLEHTWQNRSRPKDNNFTIRTE